MRLLGRLSAAVLVPITMMALSVQPAVAQQKATTVVLLASLECVEAGGANVTFTIRNAGPRVLSIEDDFHLFLKTVRPKGAKLVSIVFVFPAPDFEVIPPGEARTFLVPMGVGDEGEPGVDLRGKRLLLYAEVFFEHREEPVTDRFSFPGCPSPQANPSSGGWA
ncbi:hypothetical protein BH20ACT24_BH20ACT24_18450 [soil metagenome]